MAENQKTVVGGGKSSNPYVAYIKKVVNLISELSEETGISKWCLLCDYAGALIKHGCLIRHYRYGNFWKYSSLERKKILTYPRFVKLMNKMNDSTSVHYLEKKFEFNKHFASFVHRDWIYINEVSCDEFEKFVRKHSEVIIKPIGGQEGQGVRKFKLANNPNVEFSKLYNELKNEDVLVEQIIQQHPRMVFGNTSVNTIRTMTVLDKHGKGHVVRAILRAGVGDCDVDNYCMGGSAYEIDLETGLICTRAHSKVNPGSIYHRGTNIVMLGYQIPNWDKVIEDSCRAAECVPNLRLIGWDVAITETGTDLIEGNHNPDYELYEFFGSTGYYEKMKKYL